MHSEVVNFSIFLSLIVELQRPWMKAGTIVPDVKWWCHCNNDIIISSGPAIIHLNVKNWKMLTKHFWPQYFVWSFKNHISGSFSASIVSRLEPKKFGVPTIFYSPLLWPAKRRIIIIHQFSNFKSYLRVNDNSDWLEIFREICSQKYGFYITMFWLKVMAQNPSKSLFFQFFRFWSVKYIHNNTSSNLFRKLIWSVVNVCKVCKVSLSYHQYQ